jgi:triosephosphate isomerase (TIM)
MRKPLIAGNWKLFKTVSESIAMISALKPLVADVDNVEIVIAPVFTSISKMSDVLVGTNIRIAGQDCYWESEGAFTGEVSPVLLKDAGCTHVIIGHSERRQYFGETDCTVNKKSKAAVSAGLTAIVCVGETLAERESGETFRLIETQLAGAFEGFPKEQFGSVVVAYEPVWAIGTGKTASNEQAQEVHAFIRGYLGRQFGESVSESLRILYGGSVKPENVVGLMEQADIDGALVGGASLNADSFAAIVRFEG